MPNIRFLQVHTLSSYTATLLNRDDSGLAKRLPFGGKLRTRISSQCLKRHWRTAEDPHALNLINGAPAAIRSREIVTREVIEPLYAHYAEEVIEALEPEIQMAVYGDKGNKKKSRQTLLLGRPEIEWIANQVERLAQEANGDATTATSLAKQWKAKDFRKNIKAMREATSLPGGLTSALFGRMVTADPNANITAPVHVAHSFTVHEEEPESDYFTAVDDLSEDEPGADTIQETELTSGLYYGYVVVDLRGLLSNLGGDSDMAGKVLHNLIFLIAEVSPGAKLGSTAPYGRASFMLLEAGDRQPRSLAEAFRDPCKPVVKEAVNRLNKHLTDLDNAYSTGEKRVLMSLVESNTPLAEPCSLSGLAEWAAKRMLEVN